ncbi:unnamed protein product [Rhizophagus irregularis]|nr:unnamed protein product [Rhizophagus irregularis]
MMEVYKKISETHPSYDPLHYVLLFPKGDDGWHINIPLIGSLKREKVTAMQFYSYRLQIKDGDWLQYAGHLYQQYIVDQYAKIEQNRLNYLKLNQSILHAKLYQGTMDAIHASDNSNNIGCCIILPSSFTDWWTTSNVPIISRCNNYYKIHSIEKYDSIVSAEIPDSTIYSLAYETVAASMMYGPCGILNPSAPCMMRNRMKIWQDTNDNDDNNLNHIQHTIYDAVITILAKIRLSGEIALPIVSSGIAALLIDGGKTAHFCLKIPIKLNETSTCSIS